VLKEVRKQLRKSSSKKQAKILQRFFKTGPGEYGQRDIFLGVKVPETRRVAKLFKDLSLTNTIKLLKSSIHEERLLALLILIQKYKEAEEREREALYRLYLRHTRYINNWDLVDLSAEQIVGAFISDKDRDPLYELARSSSLWERRIAILATYHFIKKSSFDETLKISRILLTDKEDLIHKAVGWMLREVGKRNLPAEEKFLKNHYKLMPRTMLRYAIEKFPEPKRKAYLNAKI